jgi:hypothetical protein
VCIKPPLLLFLSFFTHPEGEKRTKVSCVQRMVERTSPRMKPRMDIGMRRIAVETFISSSLPFEKEHGAVECLRPVVSLTIRNESVERGRHVL